MSVENNSETAKTVGRPFKPGQSGNPGGRPKVADVFKMGCRRVVDELVLERWRDEVEKLGDNWVKCSELLAAYGYGKPTQYTELSVDGKTRDVVTEKLEKLEEESLSDAATQPIP